MAAQTVGDLRTLVVRRSGQGRRVAVLSADEALARGLAQNGHTLLVDPTTLGDVAAFRPEVVVAFDGFASDGAEGFAALARAAPEAELLFSFANASGASRLLRGLEGRATGAALSEAEVRAWLLRAGWVVATRDAVVVPHEPSGLSTDTEVALRQLLEQLNPAAAVDRLLLVARRGVAASPREWSPGLTSVVVSAGADPAALEGTVRSVAGQLQRPVELVVVSSLPELRLEDAVRPAKGRAGLTVAVVGDAPGDALARTNVGLARAQGQYVCCLEAGELLAREHLATLVRRLAEGTSAWALSPGPGTPAPFSLRGWLEAGAAQRGRAVVDRQRLGAFPLDFAEGQALGEAVWFCRLAALFPPACGAGPVTLDSPRLVASRPEAVVEALRGRPLRAVTSLERLLEAPPEAEATEVVRAALEARSPVAARAFGKAVEVVERVRDAAVQAREDVRRQRG